MNKTPALLTNRISNIAIIGLWLWADGMLIPQQTPSLFLKVLDLIFNKKAIALVFYDYTNFF